MLSVRVFFAIAGAVLISNAEQAKATLRLDCKGEHKKVCLPVELAKQENQKARSLLTAIQIERREHALQALTDAKNDFEALLKGEELDPLESLINALMLGNKAYEIVEDNCGGNCTAILTHIGKSEGWTIVAIRKLLISAEKKQKIGDLIKKHFTGPKKTDEELGRVVHLLAVEVLEVLSQIEETDSENN